MNFTGLKEITDEVTNYYKNEMTDDERESISLADWIALCGKWW